MCIGLRKELKILVVYGGGSAYKFGIYKRLDTSKTVTADNRKTDGVYAWFTKYGTTKDEAFAEIKNIILQIIKY